MKKFCLFALCLLCIMGASNAFALTDGEYQVLMKKAVFAEADQKLNEAWAAAKKAMTLTEFKALQKEQREWLAKKREAEAQDLIENGLPEAQAYAAVTNARAEEIAYRTEASVSMQIPEGPEGYYAMDEGAMQGTMLVRWADAKKSKLRIEVEAYLILSPENVRAGELSGEGELENNSVVVVADEDPEAAMTVVFDGPKAIVTTTDDFKTSGYCGMGVVLDGTYVRKTL